MIVEKRVKVDRELIDIPGFFLGDDSFPPKESDVFTGYCFVDLFVRATDSLIIAPLLDLLKNGRTSYELTFNSTVTLRASFKCDRELVNQIGEFFAGVK